MNCLQLSEKVCEKKLTLLLASDVIDASEKRQLYRYKKRINKGYVNTIYKFSRGGWHGRVFAQDGLSLQPFRREIRHTLAKDIYVDIDMVNAHPVLLEQYCNANGVLCNKLTEYVQNRNNVLCYIEEELDIDRETSKKTILKIINGGTNPYENINFLQDFSQEMCSIREYIYNAEINIQKYLKDKRRNLGGCAVNLLLCKIENDILMNMLSFFEEKGLTVGVLVFDGLMIEKDDMITPELLDECCEHLKDVTGYGIKLVIKEMDQGYDMQEFEKESYENVRKEVESVYSKLTCLDGYIKCIPDESPIVLKPSLMKHILNNRWCVTNDGRKQFYNEWIKDPDISSYDDIDFIPNIKECPEKCINLFTGFRAAGFNYLETDGISIEPMLAHISNLCGHEQESYNYFIRWLAHCIQYPGVIPEVAVVLRGQEGCGKNAFTDFFGKYILGQHYYTTTPDVDVLFGTFANGLKNKLLVNLDEAECAHTYRLREKIKNAVTNATIQYQQKGFDIITLNNYARWIFSTNNKIPLNIQENDRRFVVFDCSNSVCNDKDYFDNLYECIKNDEFCNTFYKYLLNYDLTDFNVKDRPLTKAFIEIRQACLPKHYPFLRDYLDFGCGGGKEEQSIKIDKSDLFHKFVAWLMDGGFDTARYNINTFGRDVKTIKGVSEGRTTKSRFWILNRSEVEEVLNDIYGE